MRHGVPHERHDGEVAPASSEIVAKGVEELFNHDETGGGDVVGDEVRASRAGVDGGEQLGDRTSDSRRARASGPVRPKSYTWT